MWIKEITYGTIDSGPHSGTLAYHLWVGDQDPEDGEIADAIMAIREFKGGAGKFIRLHGEFPAKNDAAVMTLLTPLKNYGYRVLAEVPGTVFHQWYNFPTQGDQSVGPMVDWLVVHLEDGAWPAFNCQEIRYHLRKDSSGKVVLPGGPARLYVVPEDVSSAQLMRFLRDREEAWAVLLYSKKNLSQLIQGGTD